MLPTHRYPWPWLRSATPRIVANHWRRSRSECSRANTPSSGRRWTLAGPSGRRPAPRSKWPSGAHVSPSECPRSGCSAASRWCPPSPTDWTAEPTEWKSRIRRRFRSTGWGSRTLATSSCECVPSTRGGSPPRVASRRRCGAGVCLGGRVTVSDRVRAAWTGRVVDDGRASRLVPWLRNNNMRNQCIQNTNHSTYLRVAHNLIALLAVLGNPHLLLGLHLYKVPFALQVLVQTGKRLGFVLLEAVALFVAQRPLGQVDGVLDVVGRLVLPRPVVRRLEAVQRRVVLDE